MKQVDVRVLVFDGVHNLLAGGPREQRVILQLFRILSNELKACVDGACVARGFWCFDDLVVGSHVFGLVMRPHDRGP